MGKLIRMIEMITKRRVGRKGSVFGDMVMVFECVKGLVVFKIVKE